MCGDDDKEHKRENVSGDHQTGDDRSPTVSPRECGGSRPTGFPPVLQISDNAELTQSLSGPSKRGLMFIQVGGNALAITGNFRPLVGQSGWRGEGKVG